MNLTPQTINLRTNNLYNASQRFLARYDQNINMQDESSFEEIFQSNVHDIESYFKPFINIITHIINITRAGIKEPKLVKAAANAIYYLHEVNMDFEDKLAKEKKLEQSIFRKKGIEVLNSWCKNFSYISHHLINLAERKLPKMNIAENLNRKAKFFGFNQAS